MQLPLNFAIDISALSQKIKRISLLVPMALEPSGRSYQLRNLQTKKNKIKIKNKNGFDQKYQGNNEILTKRNIFLKKYKIERKPAITLCFVSISKRNIAFYSSFAVHKSKTIHQRSTKLYLIGKKERNIRFFVNEGKKGSVFDLKNETLT
jgi:hypothetical protein